MLVKPLTGDLCKGSISNTVTYLLLHFVHISRCYICLSYTVFFLNMNTCISYKNIEAEICEILRINPRLRFEKDIILCVENL